MTALIVNRDCNIGDALMSIPAIHVLADVFAGGELYLAMTNREVMELAHWPENVRDILDREPMFGLRAEPGFNNTPEGSSAAYARADVVLIGIAAAIAYKFDWNAMLHPTQHIMAWCGLDVPDVVPQPQICIDLDLVEQVPEYDFLVAPWSRATARSLTAAEAHALVELLYKTYGNESRIALLGGSGDPQVSDPREDGPFASIETEYGRPLSYVVALMRKCRGAVITVDSTPNRLAHAAGIDNHVLLGSYVTPPQWQTHPKCHLYYGPPQQWNADKILRLVDECVNRVG